MTTLQKVRHDIRSSINLMNQLETFLKNPEMDNELRELFIEALGKQATHLETCYQELTALGESKD